jgi:hypothetical protein
MGAFSRLKLNLWRSRQRLKNMQRHPQNYQGDQVIQST